MGSYNGEELCDMLGLFLQNEINTTKVFKKIKFGIFRYYGLWVTQSKTPRSTETTWKSLRNIFAKWGFKIAVEAGLKQTYFLDI